MPLTKEKLKKYGDGWKLLSLRLIIERAKNKCEQCGREKTSGKTKFEKRITLTCAHLNHDETDNREINLRVLCGACHLRYDKEDNLKRRRANKRNRMKGQLILF